VSSNVAAVRLSEEVGRDKVIAAARDLGLRGDLELGPTIALGTSGVSLIDLVAAYAAVSAGRHPVIPHGLPVEDPSSDTTPMSPRVRAEMLELLRAAVNEGSGRGARLSTQAFGKTGTSQDSRDAYFIGFSGDLITGVWIGHDDNRPMPGAQGGGLPAAIWRSFMTRALAPADEAPAPRRAPREAPPPPSAARAPVVSRGYDVEQGTAGEDAPIARPLDGPTMEVPIIEVPQVLDLAEPTASRAAPPPAPDAPAQGEQPSVDGGTVEPEQ
jgi:penicillin-binding protein 1A